MHYFKFFLILFSLTMSATGYADCILTEIGEKKYDLFEIVGGCENDKLAYCVQSTSKSGRVHLEKQKVDFCRENSKELMCFFYGKKYSMIVMRDCRDPKNTGCTETFSIYDLDVTKKLAICKH